MEVIGIREMLILLILFAIPIILSDGLSVSVPPK